MAGDSGADIVVRDPKGGGLALIVQIKSADPPVTAEVVSQLKKYMLDYRCPVGLIVTPTKARVFVDSFRDLSPDSIDELDAVETPKLLDKVAPRDPIALEHALREWLERTSASWSDALPKDTATASRVLETIVPAVAEGVVSGSHG